tara:strand:+ start:566 stop:832 length:267 start_codon:yes stop_codon:yes gene_type:complete
MELKKENPTLVLPVAGATPLKDIIVEYIGKNLQPADGNITVEMAVDVFAAEFPEFLMAIAEENFLRGYQQALDDINHVNIKPDVPTSE